MQSDFLGLLLWISAHTIPGAIACAIAKRKGYSASYFWVGFFLSIFGVVWALCLRKKTDRDLIRM